jgi:hypothetical protein
VHRIYDARSVAKPSTRARVASEVTGAVAGAVSGAVAGAVTGAEKLLCG